MTDHKTVRLLLTCIDADQCTVAFEPEGATHTLRKGDAFTVEIAGTGSGEVEVSYEPDGLSIGVWGRAVTRVTNRRGEELAT